MVRTIPKYAVGASIFFALACSDTHFHGPQPGDEIALGALISLSGPNSGAGYNHMAALRCAIEDANAELAETGVRLRLAYGDTQSDPYAASVLMNTHLLQHTRIAIGPFTSAEVGAVGAQIGSSNGLLISPSSTSLQLANRDDHIFRMAPNDAHMAQRLVETMVERSHRRAILIHRDDIWGESVANEVERGVVEAGGYVQARYSYDASGTGDVATVLRSAAADISTLSESGSLLDVAVQLTSFSEGRTFFEVAADSFPILEEVTWYGSDGFVGDRAVSEDSRLAEFAEEVDYTAPIYRLEIPDRYRGVVERIRLATGVYPGTYSLLAYDAARIAARTLAEVGQDASYSDLESVLGDMAAEYWGISGTIHFDSMGDRDGGEYDLYTVAFNGWTYDWVLIDTQRRRITPDP